MTTFAQLLAPITVEAFLGDYWGRKALYVPGPRELSALLTRARFEHDVLERPWPSDVVARAVFDRAGEQGNNPQLALTSGAQAREAYRAGATVCIDRIEAFVPALRELCRNAKAVVGHAGDVGVHAYWSPDGAGFRPHFDARIATTLQIEGTKRWRFTTRPVVAWPRDNAVVNDGAIRYGKRSGERAAWETTADRDLFDPTEEVTLVPGDLLCLPAGSVHEAEASGTSLAINLHFNPLDAAPFVARLLTAALGDDAAWRNVPPLFAHGRPRQGLEGDGLEALRDRLREARALLSRWIDEPATLTADVAADLASALAPPPTAGAPAVVDAHARVGLADGVFVSAIHDDTMTLILPGHRVEAAGTVARVILSVIERQLVPVEAIEVAGVSRERTEQIVGELVGNGILRLHEA